MLVGWTQRWSVDAALGGTAAVLPSLAALTPLSLFLSCLLSVLQDGGRMHLQAPCCLLLQPQFLLCDLFLKLSFVLLRKLALFLLRKLSFVLLTEGSYSV